MSAALSRIERALARIEAAGERPRAAPDGGAEELARLREAHRSLRNKVAGAIGRIDGILGEGTG